MILFRFVVGEKRGLVEGKWSCEKFNYCLIGVSWKSCRWGFLGNWSHPHINPNPVIAIEHTKNYFQSMKQFVAITRFRLKCRKILKRLDFVCLPLSTLPGNDEFTFSPTREKHAINIICQQCFLRNVCGNRDIFVMERKYFWQSQNLFECLSPFSVWNRESLLLTLWF